LWELTSEGPEHAGGVRAGKALMVQGCGFAAETLRKASGFPARVY